jgi:nucleoid-associated protein YgaU
MTADLSAAGGAPAKWVKATPATGQVGQGASLRKLSPRPTPSESAEVKFSVNPERITVSHTFKTEGANGNNLEDQVKNLGHIEISIDKVLLFGAGTKSACETLLSWSCAAPLPIGVGKKQKYAQPILLRFTWGTGLYWELFLRQVTISYLRFETGTATPIRAEVRLNLYRNLTSTLPPPNPTSGGPPGRSAHVMDSSECLASLAEATYGRPGAWRRIAQANSIDDPLRVRPGTAVYLPEPGEPGFIPGGRQWAR